MPTSSSSTASTLQALGEQYRSITNNLANANTPGYKRMRVGFVQTLRDAIGPTSASDAEAQPKSCLESVRRVDFSQGGMTFTGSSLHVALNGRGFFRIETPNGPLYTRNGKFRPNAQRQLVDGAGRTVAGDGGGPIILPPDVGASQVQVAPDGTVSAGTQRIGKLKVVDFQNDSLLKPAGAGGYVAPAGAAERDADSASVRQGYVEDSNVSAVEELVGLITVTRLYEANLKSITMEDRRMENILKVAMS